MAKPDSPIWTGLPLHVIKYIAEEVKRQGRGPIQVYWMADAWVDAMIIRREHDVPSLSIVEHLGGLIERDKNRDGVRQVPVFVGFDEKLRWPLVPHALESLFEHWNDMSPDQRYLEFEQIHPFVDGNGRTGKILYNWDSLESPTMPPNFFGVSNP